MSTYGYWVFNGRASCGKCSSLAGQDCPPNSGHEHCGCSADWHGDTEKEKYLVLSEFVSSEIGFDTMEADGEMYIYTYETWEDHYEVRTYELQPDGTRKEICVTHEVCTRVEIVVDQVSPPDIPLEPIMEDIPLESIPE